ncbi:MAG: STAS domain-containing protein [Thiogranum sp.]
MSNIRVSVSDNGREVSIAVVGRFDFSVHKEFRDTYTNCNSAGLSFVLDLSQTEYMDSSALGMLLLLKEHADKCKGKVVLSRPAPGVRKILDIANFGKQFTIA